MFILFGMRDIKTRVKGGLELRKHCGRCGLLSDMQEHRWVKFFTLFFVPLIPISRGESLLVCKRCGAAFYPQAEDYRQVGAPLFDSGTPGGESQSQPGKTIINCGRCRGRMRIPLFLHKRVHVTCPHCGEKFDVNLD